MDNVKITRGASVILVILAMDVPMKWSVKVIVMEMEIARLMLLVNAILGILAKHVP